MSDIQSIHLKKQDKIVAYGLGLLGLIILAGVGYGVYTILPYLIKMAENTIIFMAELAIIVSMVIGILSIWNERELFIYKWKNFVRSLRKAIVREDPIGVLDTAIRRFQVKLENIEEKIAEAVAALKNQVNKQRQAQQKASDAENLFLAAKNRGEPEALQARHAVASQRWTTAAKGMQPMVDLLSQMKSSFEQARDLAANTMADITNLRDVKKVSLEAGQAGQSAVKSFKAFFGKSNDSDMADMAFDELELQINTAEAEIEQFMRVMDPALKDENLKKEAEAIAAMNRMAGVVAKKELGPAINAEILSVSKVSETSSVRR